MTDFAASMRRFMDRSQRALDAVHEKSVALALESIKDGSPVTGAKGQPVVTGRLRDSWHEESLGSEKSRIVSDSPYAAATEFAPKGTQFENGGSGSVRKTVRGFRKLVDDAVKEVL